MVTLGLCAVGTLLQGADFFVWKFMYDNYVQIITVNLFLVFILATFIYVRSFSIKPGNPDLRELAAGGQSGNMLYDWFIGRELNPRITIPLIGEIDIKQFLELRTGLMAWILYDLAFCAHQYKTYGTVADSIILITGFQTMYVLDSFWMESSVLTTMDIMTDGLGFMLINAAAVWEPFVYSWQTRYLAVYPLTLGPAGSAGVVGILSIGYYIFRSANNEKNRFRVNPKDPRVAHLKYMETKAGSKLLISGWWGIARHVNYLGDWIMAWSYCLPTGVAGYLVQHSSGGGGLAGGNARVDAAVTQGDARGWGMIFTYFYVVFFAVLLIHRERRDEEKCIRKYGDDWIRYRKIVKYRMVPGIY